MTTLRTALLLIFACTAMPVLAKQITREPQQDRTEIYATTGINDAPADRAVARSACIAQASADQSTRRDMVRDIGGYYLGSDMFSVRLDTPGGRMICVADKGGTIQTLHYK